MTSSVNPSHLAEAQAQAKDAADPLARFKNEFLFPLGADGKPLLYFTGNSLGLQPKRAQAYVLQEMEDWAKLGVEGHFHARKPWFPYHELLAEPIARVVGALPSEVVVMNSLTVNLHLMMVSFYRPTLERYRVLVLKHGFPSDRYAVESQIRFHGLTPEQALVEVGPRAGEDRVRVEDLISAIQTQGQSLALVLLEQVNYLTGQALPMREITAEARRVGAKVGWDLAHGVGNLLLRLHDWNVDFAIWCSYKYLNGGPGAVGGAFVHERHGKGDGLPRFAGWWGHDKAKRFEMAPRFEAFAGAEGWQLSNPPIFQMAALRASLEIFDEAGMDRLRQKSEQLTGFLAERLSTLPPGSCCLLTPSEVAGRGAQLSLRLKGSDPSWLEWLRSHGVMSDFRRPDVFRLAPAPLYCGFEDVFRLVEIFRTKILGGT